MATSGQPVMSVILNLSYTRGEVTDAKQPKEIRPCFGFVRKAAREFLDAPGFSQQDKVRQARQLAFQPRSISSAGHLRGSVSVSESESCGFCPNCSTLQTNNTGLKLITFLLL
jgi:hypothetical protein